MSTGNEILELKDANSEPGQIANVASSVAGSQVDAASKVETPPPASGGRPTVAIVCAVALVSAIAWGLHVRSASEAAVAHRISGMVASCSVLVLKIFLASSRFRHRRCLRSAAVAHSIMSSA